MKDMETLLRETLRDEQWELPVTPGALDRVEATAGRIRRRRRTTALAGLIAATILVAITASVLRGPAKDPPVVTPAPRFAIPGGGTISDLFATPDSLYLTAGVKVRRMDRVTGETLAVSPALPMGALELVTAGATTLWVTQRLGADQAGTAPNDPNNDQLFGLDRATLTLKAKIDLGRYESPYSTPTSLWSIRELPRGRGELVRRDLETGAVIRTVTCACPFPYYIDEQADVLWTGVSNDSQQATMLTVRLSTGQTRGIRALGPGLINFIPGEQGSAWIRRYAGGEGAERLYHLGPDTKILGTYGGERLAALRFDRGLDSAKVLGRRVWLSTHGPERLVCVDPATGAPLQIYRGSDKEGPNEEPAPVTGNGYEVFTVRNGSIERLTGPDRCLS